MNLIKSLTPYSFPLALFSLRTTHSAPSFHSIHSSTSHSPFSFLRNQSAFLTITLSNSKSLHFTIHLTPSSPLYFLLVSSPQPLIFSILLQPLWAYELHLQFHLIFLSLSAIILNNPQLLSLHLWYYSSPSTILHLLFSTHYFDSASNWLHSVMHYYHFYES